MANWKNIYINSNLIQFDYGNKYKIAFPKNSKYAGYQWNHPAKCVHLISGRKDIISIGYTDEFKFWISKYGRNGQEINAKEFEEIFEKMDSNIRPFVKNQWSENKDIDIIHTPEVLTPIENPVADKDLIDD